MSLAASVGTQKGPSVSLVARCVLGCQARNPYRASCCPDCISRSQSLQVMLEILYFYVLVCPDCISCSLSLQVMLETLYFYALAHQNDFDVCWCKGSVAEKIFTPLVERIKSQGCKVKPLVQYS